MVFFSEMARKPLTPVAVASRRRGWIGLGILAFLAYGSGVAAQDFGRYREFELGSGVDAVSTVTGVATSEVKAIHERPARIQQLTWRPRYAARRPPTQDIESVEQMVFDFYDDHLYRLTVDYDRKQTAGLTDADMIEAISAVYGSPIRPLAPRRGPATLPDHDARTRIAAWGNESHVVALYRLSSYETTFTLVVTAEPAAALARTAAARAVVLDAREAPEREAAREKKEADDRRAAEEKARSTNKPAFRP
jgi:hypothetical protein